MVQLLRVNEALPFAKKEKDKARGKIQLEEKGYIMALKDDGFNSA